MNGLFPQPQSLRRLSAKTLDLSAHDWILMPKGMSRSLRQRAMDIKGRLERSLGRKLQLAVTGSVKKNTLLCVELDASLKREEYELKISKDGIVIHAGAEAGAYYGLLGAWQILVSGDRKVQALQIRDFPDLVNRGVMLDISRCKVPSIKTLKNLIVKFSEMKLNQLQLYTEHTFAFTDHPLVWQDSSAYTHEEILEIEDYCRDYFVELVPNFNSFGHFGRFLKHQEYAHLAECPEGYTNPWGAVSDHGDTLQPGQNSLTLLRSLYEELLPNFSSALFNVGCDETWELGKGKSLKEAEKKGSTRVYLEFLQKINKEVKRHDKRMMFWGDIILHQPELIRELPKDCIALDWAYEANAPFDKTTRKFKDAGLEFYVCPGTSSWCTLSGRTDNCIGNIENAARNAIKNGASGLLNTDWGDGGHHQTLPVSYLGFCVGAALSWSYRQNKDDNWGEAIDQIFFNNVKAGMGQLWMELGRTINDAPQSANPNGTFFERILFWDRTQEGFDAWLVSVKDFERCLARLDTIESKISESRCRGEEGELATAELHHALGMCRLALRKGLLVKQGKNIQILRPDFQKLIASHEQQWLRRNRIGGLNESSNRIRKAMAGL